MYKVYNNNVVIRYNKPIVLLLNINNNIDVHVLYINISSVFIYNNILILVIHISKYTLLVIEKLLSKIGNVLHVFFFLDHIFSFTNPEFVSLVLDIDVIILIKLKIFLVNPQGCLIAFFVNN